MRNMALKTKKMDVPTHSINHRRSPLVKCPNSRAFIATQLVPTRAPQQLLLAPILSKKSTKKKTKPTKNRQVQALPGVPRRKRKNSNSNLDGFGEFLKKQQEEEDEELDMEQLNQRLEKIEIEASRETIKLQQLHHDATEKNMDVEEVRKQVKASSFRLEKLNSIRQHLTQQAVSPRVVQRPLSARGRLIGESFDNCPRPNNNMYKDPLYSPDCTNKRPKLRHAAVVRAIAESTVNDLVRTSFVRATLQMHKQIRAMALPQN